MGFGEWLRSLNINSSRKYLHDFAGRAAASIPEGALVLDAGAGDGLYKPLFDKACYESADFCQVDKEYGEITYVCDLASIPVEDDRYDLVLCSQVLEHIPEPRAVLTELFRILKPGGELWLSTPLFFAEHEIPYDYYRYTQYGLRHLLELAGFQVQKVEWLEGYYGTLSYQLLTAGKDLPLHPRDYGGGLTGLLGAAVTIPLKPFFLLLSMFYARLDIRIKHTTSGQCQNFAVVALKPPVQRQGA